MSFAADDPLSQEDACPENSNYPSEHFNQKLGPIPPQTYGANILGAVGAHMCEFFKFMDTPKACRVIDVTYVSYHSSRMQLSCTS